MEPISILSIVVQLATSAPALNKLISTEKIPSYTRTETIEIYRNIYLHQLLRAAPSIQRSGIP